MKTSLLLRRYIWLIDTIYRYGPISLADINARWMRTYLSDGEPMARVTFHRDRESIQDLFDIDIKCESREKGYGYYVENESDMKRNGIRKWMLDTITVGTIVTESQHLNKRIILENVPSGQEFLSVISRAMQNGNTLEMEYQQFGKDSRVVEVEPYCLKLYHQRWYMLARKIDREWLIVYALDRIRDLEETTNKYTIADDFDANEYFSSCFGVMKDDSTPVEHIVLRTTPRQANYLRTLPLHHSQKELKATDAYVDFSLDLSPTIDFRQEILSQMPNIEVLKPKALRDQIEATLEESIKLYKKNT